MTILPDIIIQNGALVTFDPANPAAEALAITGGLISAVGSNAGIAALAGPQTQVIDACGGTVLPGFIDSHVHLFGGAVELTCLNLYGVVGLAEMTRLIRPYAAAHPEDELVFCVMADYGILGTGTTPTRHDLDQIIADRPMALYAPDHHTIWANTAALEATGLIDAPEVDAGSTIVKGQDGKASGELLEPGAYGPILEMTRHKGRDMLGLVTGRDPSPAATPAQREMDKDVIETGLRHCAAQGITGLHLMDGNLYQLELLSELEAEGRLHCRTMVPFHFKGTDAIARIATEGVAMRDRFQGDKVWCGHMKMFIDGVIESGTALMLEPYPGKMGEDDNQGDAVFSQDHFVAATIEADRHGFQIAVHAIGDAGVRRTIDAYAAARNVNGPRDARHRIEHLEVMHPSDIPRLAALDIVASIQPGHAPIGHIFPSDDIGACLHPHQIEGAYAWQTIRDSGARVIFSTDWPVMPVDVMPNVKAAIAPLDLGPGWVDQTQSLTDTLASYTQDNAWVEFNEDVKGMLKPGMQADVVVMSCDLFALAPDQITLAHAVKTICDGQITYSAV
ncbi:amidohydrolase [Sulfitobacter sp. M57]|uniref:amidohydrolase n=1 Tax=unclassified Sulfitobacter TaxID=196795 RepID=UPI0023E24F98|nr:MULTISPECIES: amidohydrolase [unclassified Sulfitobacter]MDF3414385.1 amidohydrolase [Sulfitobacter sp. KE5]MDF3420333.1 amidohydrolase [Sulfitobacter sp. KE43]MDF3432931.1 amidohydrolase [Sulfitobacter sp. KE42]MDF3458571.1 amidohydrolase [Sulfitobacter sp. S74]MDF3462471.1 amidohydrolase [Sulfitobacter sp. Ks18]